MAGVQTISEYFLVYYFLMYLIRNRHACAQFKRFGRVKPACGNGFYKWIKFKSGQGDKAADSTDSTEPIHLVLQHLRESFSLS